MEHIFPRYRHDCFLWIFYFHSSFIYITTHSMKSTLFGLSAQVCLFLRILKFKLPAFSYISICHIYAVFNTEVVLLIYSVFHAWLSVSSTVIHFQVYPSCFLDKLSLNSNPWIYFMMLWVYCSFLYWIKHFAKSFGRFYSTYSQINMLNILSISNCLQMLFHPNY